MDESTKIEMPNESNCATTATTKNEISSTQLTNGFSPFCRSDCIVCNSGILKEIHEWRPAHTLDEIVELAKKENGLEVSRYQLHRHFKNFNKVLSGQITKHMENFDLKVETLSEHQNRVLFLGKIAFDQILDRINAGTLTFTLDDYEKIMKLFYNTMKDPSAAATDSAAMIALFQKAAERGGAPMQQMALISMPARTQPD